MFKSLILLVIAGAMSATLAQSGKCFLGINEPIEDNELVLHNSPAKKILTKDTEIKILVWNIFKFRLPGIFKDMNAFAQDNDILVLQENYLTNKVVTYLMTNELAKHHHITAPSFLHKGYGTGVTISTKFKLDEAYSLRTTVTEPIVKTPKMSLYTYFDVKGLNDRLLVISVHGINFVSTKKFKIHMNQIFAEISTHDGPLILAGDFNTHLKKRTKFFFSEALKYGIVNLKPSTDDRGLKLDHILVRGLVAKSVELRTDITTSDHPPIEARLVFE